MRKGINPYSGDSFHETPLTLWFVDYLVTPLPQVWISGVFILCDLITALLLALMVEQVKGFYVRERLLLLIRSEIMWAFPFQFLPDQKRSTYPVTEEEGKQLKIPQNENYGELVIMAYLLNPFTILNCVGQTTTVFGNLVLALSLLSMVKGRCRCGRVVK